MFHVLYKDVCCNTYFNEEQQLMKVDAALMRVVCFNNTPFYPLIDNCNAENWKRPP